jgi:hypothetical protein
MDEAILRRKRTFAVVTALFVASLHFVTGPQYIGPFPDFVNGYLIDILGPFAAYFLLSLKLEKLLHKIWAADAVFLVGVTVELLQYFDVPVFGSTFDPLDFVMYGLGSFFALAVDLFFISRDLPSGRHSDLHRKE